MAEQTKRRLITTGDETETETEVRSKNTPAVTDYAIGAMKDNKMKIFEIIILINHLQPLDASR